MKFTRTEIPEVVLVEPIVHGDDRGYFVETFRLDKIEQFLGHKVSFCQDNESKSGFGVLRGLHFQLPPFAQTKLVRVIQGEILDVAVDIRKGSPTFGMHVSVCLSDQNKKQLFVPRGFAHGFVVLSELCVVAYKVDNFYNQKSDRGIMFNDNQIGIDWRILESNMKLSIKDRNQPKLSETDCFEFGENFYA